MRDSDHGTWVSVSLSLPFPSSLSLFLCLSSLPLSLSHAHACGNEDDVVRLRVPAAMLESVNPSRYVQVGISESVFPSRYIGVGISGSDETRAGYPSPHTRSSQRLRVRYPSRPGIETSVPPASHGALARARVRMGARAHARPRVNVSARAYARSRFAFRARARARGRAWARARVGGGGPGVDGGGVGYPPPRPVHRPQQPPQRPPHLPPPASLPPTARHTGLSACQAICVPGYLRAGLSACRHYKFWPRPFPLRRTEASSGTQVRTPSALWAAPGGAARFDQLARAKNNKKIFMSSPACAEGYDT